MVSYDYATEKLYLATLGLVRGEGGIKDRLEGAAVTLIILRPEKDVPEKLRAEFESIHSELTSEPAQFEGEGTIRATIRQLSPDEASQIAERIFHLYGKLLHGSSL